LVAGADVAALRATCTARTRRATGTAGARRLRSVGLRVLVDVDAAVSGAAAGLVAGVATRGVAAQVGAVPAGVAAVRAAGLATVSRAGLVGVAAVAAAAALRDQHCG